MNARPPFPAPTAAPPLPIPTRPTQRRTRQQIQAAIRQAAIVEFSTHGFKGASTQTIAAQAGLSKPQLNYYIASKQALYEELLHGQLQGWSAAFAFDAAHDDPRTTLALYVQRKLDYAFAHPHLSRIYTAEMLAGAPRLQRYWPAALACTEHKVAVLERWMREGRMRQLNARVLIQQIWGMTQYYADYSAQAERMQGPSATITTLDRAVIACELTTSVLLTCGLAPA